MARARRASPRGERGPRAVALAHVRRAPLRARRRGRRPLRQANQGRRCHGRAPWKSVAERWPAHRGLRARGAACAARRRRVQRASLPHRRERHLNPPRRVPRPLAHGSARGRPGADGGRRGSHRRARAGWWLHRGDAPRAGLERLAACLSRGALARGLPLAASPGRDDSVGSERERSRFARRRDPRRRGPRRWRAHEPRPRLP